MLGYRGAHRETELVHECGMFGLDLIVVRQMRFHNRLFNGMKCLNFYFRA